MNKIFNEARMAYQGQILTAKEITTLLSDMPNSTNNLFLTVLVKHNAIKRVGKGQYMFTVEPVHHSILEKAMDEIRDRQRTYNKKATTLTYNREYISLRSCNVRNQCTKRVT